MATVGNGEYSYEPVENWAKLPPGWSFKEIGGVGVDRNDNVFVFNRGEHPMIVFDREGNFLRSFGEGLFPRAHGVVGQRKGQNRYGRLKWPLDRKQACTTCHYSSRNRVTRRKWFVIRPY
jgi:hypothetical protein